MRKKTVNLPSNPFNFWISGGERRAFVYTQGCRPYYVQVRTKGWIGMSVVVFADNVRDVKNILRELVDFRKECAELYKLSDGNLADHYERSVFPLIKKYLNDKPSPGTVTIEPINTTVALKVGWAENDTCS